MNDPHLGFIVASYAIGLTVVVALIGWTILDYRAQSRALAELEARSGRRRSRP
ncbi:heme exporter protein CcmD [Hansschlegelia beijingensis]|uniref:Heme exporter protein D n=1 Tax=Hansschlegelia beijingensis TaxID=1133344 RepID=A0A7W6CXJ1_9HYPH|nr:heme exporter protein CcmD [Hansschlegelia beijingensis]MBB3972953.1 heme exporter protein D [Hansschlegelia beijingensis]